MAAAAVAAVDAAAAAVEEWAQSWETLIDREV